MGEKALIVDDDLVLADVVSFTLRRAGFEVVTAHNGRAALLLWKLEQPSVIILDWQLPEIDGIQVCREIRQHSDVAILLLTVRDGDKNVLEGLQAGADDYITKPFSPTQLVARVQAVRRRSGQPPVVQPLIANGLALNPEFRTLNRPDRDPLYLTVLEYRLIEALIINKGHVLTADALIRRVWGANNGDKAMLKQLVYRLRRKLNDPDHLSVIEVVPGIGYALMQH